MALLLILPLLLQGGPMVSGGAAPSLNLPQIDRPTTADRRRRAGTIDRPASFAAPNRLEVCMAQANSRPDTAITTAQDWLKLVKGAPATEPQLCLGTAYATKGEWQAAQEAFLAGRDAAPASEQLTRARLGTMAANAALAGGDAKKALALLDEARALATSDIHMTGEIATDRARALVALKRNDDATAALAQARSANPDDPAVWLLSATLSRRMGKLPEAQSQIESAARLAPTDADIGLEAGVIAMLSGHEAAARKSWQSAVLAAPESDASKRAAAYLAQLGPVGK